MLRPLLAVLVVCAGLAAGDCAGADLRLAPPAGTYGVVIPVVPLVRLAAGERLVYTLDGSAPTAASWPVNNPILITDTTTVRVATLSSQGVVTRSVSGTYIVSGVLSTARPVAAPPAGAYPASQLVTLTCPTAGAEIRYTLDGSQPTPCSPRYSAPITIAASTTLRARAFGGQLQVPVGRFTLRVPAVFPSGVMTATYVITGQQQQVATPVIAPATGLYRTALAATATSATAGAELRYRLDGADPGPSDALVTADGVAIERSAVLSVAAFRSGWTPSAVARATYTLQVPEPAITPASALVNAPLTAAITIPSGATVRYTTDGSDPDAGSAAVSGPIAIDRNLQLRARAERDGWTPSAVVSAAYVLQPLAPTASLPAGTYTGEQAVTLSDATAATTIHYTLDGTPPTAASPVATGPVALSGSCTLTAVATRSGWTDSQPLVLAYALQVPVPTLTPASGTHGAPIQIQAVAATGEVHVTTDGTDPSSASPLLPGAGLTLDAPASVAVIAVRDGWTASPVVRADHAFQVATPTWTTAPAPAVGSVTVAAQTVSPGAVLHYTLDGSQPTAASPELPVTLTRSRTVTVVGFRDGWQASAPLGAVWAVTPTIAFTQAGLTLPVSAGAVAVPIQLSDAADQDVTVTVQGVDGTAAFGTDVTVTPTSLTIPAGQTTASCAVQALAGAADRPTVQAQLRLAAPVNAALGTQAEVALTIPGVAGPPPTFTQRRTPLYRRPVEAFDAARWANDEAYRTAYLAASVPERVWETLPPTVKGSTLVISPSSHVRAGLGQSVTIAIRGCPNMPVTWMVDRLGSVVINGQDSSQTVVCDASGGVSLELRIAGTGCARLVIGSPSCVGTGTVTIEGVQP